MIVGQFSGSHVEEHSWFNCSKVVCDKEDHVTLLSVERIPSHVEAAHPLDVHALLVLTAFVQQHQRWKNVRIVRIYPCYFSYSWLIFWLYTRKQTVLFLHCAISAVLLVLCS